MDDSRCHIVYVSPIVGQDQILPRYAALDGLLGIGSDSRGLETLKDNLKALLEFNDGLSTTPH
jgi:hypothetical protein